MAQGTLNLGFSGVEWSPLGSGRFIKAEECRYLFDVNGRFPLTDWRRKSRESKSLARPVASY
jgi:hypothetical protein